MTREAASTTSGLSNAMPPVKQRRDRLDPDRRPVGVDRRLDAGHAVEARVGVDVRVVRRLDEDVEQHLAGVGRERAPLDPPDLDLTVEDGRADIDVTRLVGVQREPEPRGAALGQGRLDQPGELVAAFALAAAVPVDLDVGARQERAEPGDLGRVDARVDDPEARVVVEVGGELRVEPGLEHDRVQVVREAHRLDLPDVDVVAPDARLPGDHAVGRRKADLDERAALGVAPPQHERGEHERRDREQPREREACRKIRPPLDGRFGGVSTRHRVRCRRSCRKGPRPRSAGHRARAPRAS